MPAPPVFAELFILKKLKVVCFDTDLQVFILKAFSRHAKLTLFSAREYVLAHTPNNYQSCDRQILGKSQNSRRSTLPSCYALIFYRFVDKNLPAASNSKNANDPPFAPPM
jgi:hypothetical protein